MPTGLTELVTEAADDVFAAVAMLVTEDIASLYEQAQRGGLLSWAVE